MIAAPLEFPRPCPGLQCSLWSPSEFSCSNHQHLLIKPAIINVVDQRRHHLVIHRQSMTHDRGQVDVDRVVIPARCVHRLDATRNADGDKADSRFHQTPRDERVLSPFVPVLRDQPRIFLREVKCLTHLVGGQDLNGRAIEFID